MQFDQKTLQRLLGENDEVLWATIRAAAARSGISLPAGQPSPKEMARLRAIMGNCGEDDVAEAMRVIRRAQGGE